MYRLIFLSGPLKGKRLAIRQGPVTIGRDPECHIAVADNKISRKHAVIELRDDGFYIRDLGSVNGILVNDKVCRESKLKHGDIIEIGRTKILFQQMGQDDTREERRVTHSQGLAFAAVICIILVQLAFVVGFSVWRRDVAKIQEKAPSAYPSQTGGRRHGRKQYLRRSRGASAERKTIAGRRDHPGRLTRDPRDTGHPEDCAQTSKKSASGSVNSQSRKRRSFLPRRRRHRCRPSRRKSHRRKSTC